MLILVRGHTHRAAGAPVIAVRAAADGRLAAVDALDAARFPQAVVAYLQAGVAGKLGAGRALLVADGDRRVALVLARAACHDPWSLADLACGLRMLRCLLTAEAEGGRAATVALPTFASQTTRWPDVRRLLREEFAGYPGDVEVYMPGENPVPFATPARGAPAPNEGTGVAQAGARRGAIHAKPHSLSTTARPERTPATPLSVTRREPGKDTQ